MDEKVKAKDDLIADLSNDIIENEEVEELKEKSGKRITSEKKIDNRGGKREGAGRPAVIKKLSSYESAINLLDESILNTLQVLIDGLNDDDKWYRKSCAESLLKKTIPDKKRDDGKDKKVAPIILIKSDIQEAVSEVDHLLESRIKKKKIIDGEVVE